MLQEDLTGACSWLEHNLTLRLRLAKQLLLLTISALIFNLKLWSSAQISCFAPSSFSWRQAAYVDSYCWAAVQQKQPSQSNLENIPLWLHKVRTGLWEISESHFKYPIVEQYLRTKKNSKCLIIKYIFCRLLTLVIIFLACLYLGYYISLSSLSDEFLCTIKTGILKNDTTVPEVVQCKLIAVGVFKVLSYINLIVYLLVMPLVVYAMFVPFRWNSGILKVYEILPTFDVLKLKSKCLDDLSLYLLFLEENVSELKSYKCLKVLENIAVSEKFDVMQLLINLGTIKTDTVDGKPGTAVPEKPEETPVEELEKDTIVFLLNVSFLKIQVGQFC
uniref:Pannexin n=1 Tax=Anser cygnoides TaxID=8845 RepID=A0A8B9IMF4_ANSCY